MRWQSSMRASGSRWLCGLGAAVLAAVLAGTSPGESAAGKQRFEQLCTGCHGLDADKEGPRLRGVFGRRAGSVAGYMYSDALKSSAIVWNEDSLERWLSDPEKFVPDSDMGFRVGEAADRAAIVGYLRGLSKTQSRRDEDFLVP